MLLLSHDFFTYRLRIRILARKHCCEDKVEDVCNHQCCEHNNDDDDDDDGDNLYIFVVFAIADGNFT